MEVNDEYDGVDLPPSYPWGRCLRWGRYQGGGKCPVTGSHRSSSLSLLHCYRLQRGVDVDFKAADNAAYT